MQINEVIAHIQPRLTEKRFEHVLRVADTALKLATRYNESMYKVELAALFHDYAKCQSSNELKQYIQNSSLPQDLLKYDVELWHGPVGAILVGSEYGIKDSDVLHAIRYHTTGRESMSKLELIIFLADYIEPGRNFPGVDEVREMAQKDLINAAWMVSRNTIQFLMQKKARIYPDTIHAYNDLTKHLKGAN